MAIRREIDLILGGRYTGGTAIRSAARDVKELEKLQKAAFREQAALKKQESMLQDQIVAKQVESTTNLKKLKEAERAFYTQRSAYMKTASMRSDDLKKTLATELDLRERIAKFDEQEVPENASRYKSAIFRLEAAQNKIERLRNEQERHPELRHEALSRLSRLAILLRIKSSNQAADVGALNNNLTGTTARLAAIKLELGSINKELTEAVVKTSLWDLAMGRKGGSKGIRIPFLNRLGYGNRVGRGFPVFGSLLALAGFGAERIVTAGLGIAGSIGGAVGGAGLYGLGVAGPAAVGMATNLSGIGQATGDIKTTATNLSKLHTAIEQYGKDSTQAATAQLQLNTDLADFSPIARNAVLAAAKVGLSFGEMFDQVTGLAEKTGAQIVKQAIGVGKSFLPAIGTFAGQNLNIIQKGLQPLFKWMQGTGRSQGFGIFVQLEQTFQRRLPQSIHAGTQAFEVFLNLVNDASKRTGGFMKTLDKFFTGLNTPAGLAAMNKEVIKLMDLFTSWFHVLSSGAHFIWDLAKPMAGFGKAFADILSQMFRGMDRWVKSASMAGTLNKLFEAHKEQLTAIWGVLVQLGPGIGAIVEAFLTLEGSIAGGTIPAFETFGIILSKTVVPVLQAVAWLIKELVRIPLAGQLLGMAAAFLIVKNLGLLSFGLIAKAVGVLGRAFLLLGPKAAIGAAEATTALGATEVAAVTLGATLRTAFLSALGPIGLVVAAIYLVHENMDYIVDKASALAGHLGGNAKTSEGSQPGFSTLFTHPLRYLEYSPAMHDQYMRNKPKATYVHNNPYPVGSQAYLEYFAGYHNLKIGGKPLFDKALNTNILATKGDYTNPIYKAGLAAANKHLEQLALHYDSATKAAKQYGVVATKAFTDAYNAMIKAEAAQTADPSDPAKLAAFSKAQTTFQNTLMLTPAKVADAAATAAATAQDTLASVLSNIQSMYDDFLSQEQSIMGTLFSGPFMNSPRMQNMLQYGYKTTGGDLLRDLKSQVSQFKEFHADLNKLQAHGAPAELIKQLMQMGPSALPQIKALLSSPNALQQSYFSEFRKSQQLIQQQTMTDLRAQLNQYKKFGSKVALAIVSGIQSQNVAVTNALKNMINDMFPGLATTAAGTPTPVTHHPHHRRRHHRPAYHPVIPPSPWLNPPYSSRNPTGTNTTTHHNYTYQITAPADSNIDTQIRHADYHARQRRRQH